jgi:SAM-dependent methyltransferase
VDSPLNLLRECNRVLKSDGLIIVAVPNEASFPNEVGLDKYWHGHPTHIYSFSVTNLETLLAKAHFKPSHFFFDPYLVGKTLSVTCLVDNFLVDLFQVLPKRLALAFSQSYLMFAQKT